MSEPHASRVAGPALMGDQADGLRRLFGVPPVTLTVAARDTAVIEAYAMIKHAVHERSGRTFRIAVAHARTPEEAQTVFDNLRRVAHEYLGVRLEYLGMTAARMADDVTVMRTDAAGAACHDSVL